MYVFARVCVFVCKRERLYVCMYLCVCVRVCVRACTEADLLMMLCAVRLDFSAALGPLTGHTAVALKPSMYVAHTCGVVKIN